MWFSDNRKFNKRIGTTLNLYPRGDGIFEFDSERDKENDLVPSSNDKFYAPHGHSEYIFDEGKSIHHLHKCKSHIDDSSKANNVFHKGILS